MKGPQRGLFHVASCCKIVPLNFNELRGLSANSGRLLYSKWRDHYGKPDDDVLVIRAPSQVLTVVGDRYAQGFVVSAFAACGITYLHSERDRSEIYSEALPLFSSGRVRLLENKTLVNQLASLERRTMPGGKDRINHPDRGHDDAANSACGVLANVSIDRRPALVRPSDMAAPSHLEAYQPPLKALYVVAFVVAGERGEGAVVYGAQNASAPNPLVVCDFDVGPVSAGSFASIAAKLEELRVQCRTTASAIWCDETLLLFARSTGANAHPIPKEFRAEDRLLSVAGHVASGAIKITGTVAEKAKTSPFSGALNLRAGEGVDDPLRNALVSLVALCLDDERLAA